MEKQNQIKIAVQIVCNYLGITVSDEVAEIIGVVVFFGSLFVTTSLILYRAYLWVRRKFGDNTAISDEQLAVVQLIKADIETIKRSVTHIGSAMNENFQSQMQTLSTQIGEVKVNTTPVEPVEEVEEKHEKKPARMFVAQVVRAAAFDKFEDGHCFSSISTIVTTSCSRPPREEEINTRS